MDWGHRDTYRVTCADDTYMETCACASDTYKETCANDTYRETCADDTYRETCADDTYRETWCMDTQGDRPKGCTICALFCATYGPLLYQQSHMTVLSIWVQAVGVLRIWGCWGSVVAWLDLVDC